MLVDADGIQRSLFEPHVRVGLAPDQSFDTIDGLAVGQVNPALHYSAPIDQCSLSLSS